MESYIPVAVLACNNGYYITTQSEVDTNKADAVDGGEYRLKWSIKKPYTIQKDTTLYSVNMNNKHWISATGSKGSSLNLETGLDYTGKGITADDVIRTINTKITNDMLFQINQQNSLKDKWDYKFYLPPTQTTTGVNAIEKPSLLIIMQGVDIASSHKLDAINIAGLKAIKKKVVLGFEKNGIKYYCYEGQMPEDEIDLIEDYFDSMEDAAKAGYTPNYEYLTIKIPD